MKTYLKYTAAAIAATLTLAGCSSPENPAQQSTTSKSLNFEEIHEGHYGTLTGVWASADSKLLIDNDSITWMLNAKRYGTIYGRHFAPTDESTAPSYAKATGTTQDGAYVLTWSPADSNSAPNSSASAQASGSTPNASSSAAASSAPSSTAEGSTAPSEASSASATPSASASANTQATNGAQSSTPSGARLIIYPVGIAIKNPTGSVVDSDTSTVRIVAIPDTTTTDYTKYVMKQVSTALPSTTTASASASASAVPSSSMSFSPSPSAPASEPAQEEKKPLSLGMNLDQIAKGDFSSIQGAWQSNARSLFVENNKAEWSVNGRAYAELSGLKYYGVQSRGAQGAATVTRENGALIMRWPDGQMLSFYPAGVKIPRTEFGIGGPNTPYLDTEDWKDRIVSGKPADGPGLSSTIMSRISDTPEYAKVSGGIAISDADPADYAPQGSFSGQGGLVFQIGTTNGKPNLCSINKVNGARCEIISEKQDAETAGGATGSYKASIVPTRPQASGGPVEAYFSYYTQSVYVAADTRATHKTLQVVQQLSADGITCAVVADSTVRCTETSGAGFLVSPHGVVRLPVQDKLYYFNSEFVTD